MLKWEIGKYKCPIVNPILQGILDVKKVFNSQKWEHEQIIRKGKMANSCQLDTAMLCTL